MKKDLLIDYLACAVIKIIGPIIRIMPLGFSLFLGRCLGEIIYYFDGKHRTLVFSNIKKALGKEKDSLELYKLVKNFYRKYGQNMIDLFLLPIADNKFIEKYMAVEGRENIAEGFRKGKGVILLAMHAGSWELSNAVCSSLGFKFSFFIRQQKWPRLNKLLNSYRKQRGCRIIEKERQLRYLIEALKRNEAVGMTVDQGGKLGTLVKFFGTDASIPTGAMRLALKYNSAILPVYYLRLKSPYNKVIIDKPFEIVHTGNSENDLLANINNLLKIYENWIRYYPDEYLWTYKVWKYSKSKHILVLSDAKTGHLRQSQALLGITADSLKEKGQEVTSNFIEVKFKSSFAKNILIFKSLFFSKYTNKFKLKALKDALEPACYKELMEQPADIVISAGSSLALVNSVLSNINLAKSLVIMKPPAYLGMDNFNLVIAPKHDNPQESKKVLVTQAALNLINDKYLKNESEGLFRELGRNAESFGLDNIGFLIGGDTKDFRLDKDLIKDIILQLKNFTAATDKGLLVTTSRRTAKEIEVIVKAQLADFKQSKLLIIANEFNTVHAVGGILGLSQIVIVSPESISMVSEAASSGKVVVVFDSRVSAKHRRFLKTMNDNGYIYLVKPEDLLSVLNKIKSQGLKTKILQDNLIIKEELGKTL